MSTFAESTQENQAQSESLGFEGSEGPVTQQQFSDNRPEAPAQQAMQLAANNSPQVQQLMQLQAAVNGSSETIQRQEPDSGESERDTETAETEANDPFTAPLSEAELLQIRQWRTTNTVNSDELTDDADHNHTLIANQIFYKRYIDNDYQLQNGGPVSLQCLAPEVVLRDPRVAVVKRHVEALGPIIDWTDVTSSNRQVHVMEQLIDTYGFPVNGAAGVVGNLMSESGVQPNRIEGSHTDTPMRSRGFDGNHHDWTPEEIRDRSYSQQEGPRLPGVGLAQWTTGNRRDGLFEHEYEGEVQGADILFSMDAQIDYLVTELQGDYRGVYNVVTAENVSVNDAADDVVYRFEIPGAILTDTTPRRKRPRTDPQVQTVFGHRRANANAALAAYRAVHPEQPAGGNVPPPLRPGGGPQ